MLDKLGTGAGKCGFPVMRLSTKADFAIKAADERSLTPARMQVTFMGVAIAVHTMDTATLFHLGDASWMMKNAAETILNATKTIKNAACTIVNATNMNKNAAFPEWSGSNVRKNAAHTAKNVAFLKRSALRIRMEETNQPTEPALMIMFLAFPKWSAAARRS